MDLDSLESRALRAEQQVAAYLGLRAQIAAQLLAACMNAQSADSVFDAPPGSVPFVPAPFSQQVHERCVAEAERLLGVLGRPPGQGAVK